MILEVTGMKIFEFLMLRGKRKKERKQKLNQDVNSSCTILRTENTGVVLQLEENK